MPLTRDIFGFIAIAPAVAAPPLKKRQNDVYHHPATAKAGAAPPLQMKNLGAELSVLLYIRVTEWRIFVTLVDKLPGHPTI